jgi:hypothetical protein
MKTLSQFKQPTLNYSIFLIVFLFAFSFRGVCDTTNIITAFANVEIHSFNPDTNYSGLSSVVSGQLGNGETRRALYRFNLSSIPTNAIVTSASVKVTVTQVPNHGGAPTSIFDLRRILRDWSAGTVTWNTPWQGPGISDSTDVSSTASASVFVADFGDYTFTNAPSLIGDVQLWISNSSANFGWLLISQDEVTAKTARHFASGPPLTISYTVPPPPPPPPVVYTNLTVFDLGYSGNQFTFNFNADSNTTYTVESLGSLTTINWATVTNFDSTNIALIRGVTNSLTSSNRFFRVKTP